MLGVVLTVWLGLFLVVMGVATTGLAVIIITLTIGLTCLVGGAWLTLYLLRRDAQFNLHLPLIALIVFGGGAVIIFAYSLLRAV
jgi:uncharacterized SAM-binding protein YcdF (DUF218 family)